MTDDFSGPNVLKLSVVLVILLHGSSITIVDANVSAVANVTEYHHVDVPSQAFSSSPLPLTRHGQIDEMVQKSSEDSDARAVAVVELVEAPVEVIGPRVVESGNPGKVEKKRENRLGTGPKDFRSKNRNYASALRKDNELDEASYKANDGQTQDDSAAAVRGSERPVTSGKGEDEEYDDGVSAAGSEMIGNEVEDDDDDGDADDVVEVDSDKRRRDLRRKTGRRYRQGPKIWDQWGKWTSCSVSCGAGKLTRWRHCVAGGCSLGEKEAQLKTCTYSAC